MFIGIHYTDVNFAKKKMQFSLLNNDPPPCIS